MKRIPAAMLVLLATTVAAMAAETTERKQSVLDANPECMERNGPDCVLGRQVVPPRAVAPPGLLPPQGVAGTPAPAAPVATAPAAPAQPSVLISPRR